MRRFHRMTLQMAYVFYKKRVHYLCENTSLWEGERKYTRYTYRGISLKNIIETKSAKSAHWLSGIT